MVYKYLPSLSIGCSKKGKRERKLSEEERKRKKKERRRRKGNEGFGRISVERRGKLQEIGKEREKMMN